MQFTAVHLLSVRVFFPTNCSEQINQTQQETLHLFLRHHSFHLPIITKSSVIFANQGTYAIPFHFLSLRCPSSIAIRWSVIQSQQTQTACYTLEVIFRNPIKRFTWSCNNINVNIIKITLSYTCTRTTYHKSRVPIHSSSALNKQSTRPIQPCASRYKTQTLDRTVCSAWTDSIPN